MLQFVIVLVNQEHAAFGVPRLVQANGRAVYAFAAHQTATASIDGVYMSFAVRIATITVLHRGATPVCVQYRGRVHATHATIGVHATHAPNGILPATSVEQGWSHYCNIPRCCDLPWVGANLRRGAKLYAHALSTRLTRRMALPVGGTDQVANAG